MHELSIATSVVQACAERAAGAHVLRVRLERCVCGDAARIVAGDELRVKDR